MSHQSELTFKGGEPIRDQRVLIVGGSTRAAAWSALRAGFQPVCADLFADLDTREVSQVIPVRSYPDSLPDDTAEIGANGWFYTGALENRPDLIERMQRPDSPIGPLWGTPAASLRLIRNPFWVRDTLRLGGYPVLGLRAETSPPPADGQWLRKPVSSAGGRSVCVWDQSASRSFATEKVWFQQRQQGLPMAALYRRNGMDLQLLGMSRQLTDVEVSRSPEPFSYQGSIGPRQVDEATSRRLTDAVSRLASQSGMQGLFGVDFVLDDAGVPWILEVNPRYTASIEVLELALQQSFLSPATSNQSKTRTTVVAKLILYADRSLTAPDFSSLRTAPSTWQVPGLADIPAVGQLIDSTWPLCTVLATGQDEDDCLARLHDRANAIWKLVDGWNSFQKPVGIPRTS